VAEPQYDREEIIRELYDLADTLKASKHRGTYHLLRQAAAMLDRDPATVLSMAEALRRGAVMRVLPERICGQFSPETQRPCRLEPGHEGVHYAFGDGPELIGFAGSKVGQVT
jgi:hypothetical protein